jgi:uncharacterized protein YkwD
MTHSPFTVWRRVLLATVLGAALAPAYAASAVPAHGDGFVRHLAQLVNEYRERHGLSPLSVTEDLIALAGEHSHDMSQRQQLSHQGFRARFQRANSRVCVENVGWNHRTPEALLDGWRRSPEHHRNLLDPGVARMGIAVATRYVTFFACR